MELRHSTIGKENIRKLMYFERNIELLKINYDNFYRYVKNDDVSKAKKCIAQIETDISKILKDKGVFQNILKNIL